MCGFRASILTNNLFRLPNKNNDNYLKKRGPDQSNKIFLHDQNLFLEFWRLDIRGGYVGDQPIYSSSRRWCLLFNGEIYNVDALKKNQNKLGKNISDTKIFVEGLEKNGISFIKKIEGMYAFFAIDLQNNEIFFGRDEFGEKPLYYSYEKGELIISSSYISCSNITEEKKISQSSNTHNLLFGRVHTNLSPLEKVREVQSGSIYHSKKKNNIFQIPLVYFKNNLFDGFFCKSNSRNISSTAKIKNNVQNELTRRIELIFNDHNPCLLLSGGVDSSLLAIISKKVLNKKFELFTIQNIDPRQNESNQAVTLSKKLSLDINVYRPNNHEIADHILQLSKIMDFPILDSSLIYTSLIHKKIKEKGYKVSMGGDGADELFGGYRRHIAAHYFDNFLIKFFSRALRSNFRYSRYIISKNPIFQNLSFQLRQIPQKSYKNINEVFENYKDYSDLEYIQEALKADNALIKSMIFDLGDYLPNDILKKVDYASMLNGVECRSPYLSLKFYEMIYEYNSKNMIKNFNGKSILRDIITDLGFQTILNNKKKGFSLPIQNIINFDLYDWSVKNIKQFMEINDTFFKYFNKDDINHLYSNKRNLQYSTLAYRISMLNSWQNNALNLD